MTAIVGVVCTDGVVIGSDSSATFGATPQHLTIEQPTEKVFVIEGSLVLAGTGQIGLHQRFRETVKKYWSAKSGIGKPGISICTELCHAIRKDFGHTGVSGGQYGALLGLVADKKPQLCEFSLVDMQPEMKESLWWASMGSGQQITDPFMGFLRRVFWSQTRPTLKEGIFAVNWTLRHVIELNPGGINEPVQIATLQQSGAKLLTTSDLLEHTEFAKAAELHLAKYRDTLIGKNAPDIPAA